MIYGKNSFHVLAIEDFKEIIPLIEDVQRVIHDLDAEFFPRA